MALVAKYSLNGNANDSLGVNNGTATNVTWVDGKLNQAGSFNGSTSNILLSSTIPGLNRGFSVSILFNSSVTGGAYRTMFSQDNSSLDGFLIGWFSSSGRFGITVPNVASILYTDGSYIDGKRHLGVITIGTGSTASVNIYIDGVLVKSGTTSLSMNVGGTPAIGSDLGGTAGFFNGQIDEVEIYNHVLTPGEIKMKYLYYLGYI